MHTSPMKASAPRQPRRASVGAGLENTPSVLVGVTKMEVLSAAKLRRTERTHFVRSWSALTSSSRRTKHVRSRATPSSAPSSSTVHHASARCAITLKRHSTPRFAHSLSTT
ncbi:hypothetical protein SPRG_21131 [Saprolegnia parasitica CBS 223.65]|uniref:Uncharacterized protein n=1 Tax=Saprolegnia parasitica (strain CBS 223.65) TaxID=695850 RepID=A0A067C606_SAPPC|nr:hypothetical protein SPRG_21131 [Saprolegnia parasitica CBS 223.65]KDO22207.1 hypothetical protein SPRG_21131 [Saprolegnia parasitica CBS 223.65]|eukprot:XP_012207085.1 hypothetical protein SPRG_21131 [Saprolegnia parasitica CBS 223.65]